MSGTVRKRDERAGLSPAGRVKYEGNRKKRYL